MTRIITLFVLEFLVGYIAACYFFPRMHRALLSGLAIGLGMGYTSIGFFIISIMGLRVTSTMILVWLCITLLSLIIILAYRKKLLPLISENIESVKKLLTSDYGLFDLFLFGLCSILILSVLYLSLQTGYNMPDEFSYWGVAAKRIFEMGSIDLRGLVLGGFERYPLLLPINSATVTIMLGSFAENFTKIIPFMAFLGCGLTFFGAIRTMGISRRESLLFLLILLTAGRMFTRMGSILYADVLFAFYYGAAIYAFIIYVRQRKNLSVYMQHRMLVGSGFLLALTCWSKIEGLYIVLPTVAIMYLLFFYERGEKKLKGAGEFAYILVPTLSIPVSWAIYSRLMDLGRAGWTEKLFGNTVFAIENLDIILRNMFTLITRSDYYTPFWIVSMVITILGIFLLRKSKEYLFLLILILLNTGYLFASYLFILSAAESLRAASFERYVIHFMPLILLECVLVYEEFKRIYND